MTAGFGAAWANGAGASKSSRSCTGTEASETRTDSATRGSSFSSMSSAASVLPLATCRAAVHRAAGKPMPRRVSIWWRRRARVVSRTS